MIMKSNACGELHSFFLLNEKMYENEKVKHKLHNGNSTRFARRRGNVKKKKYQIPKE